MSIKSSDSIVIRNGKSQISTKDRQLEIIEGNRNIGAFMGETSIMVFEDNHYWLNEEYHSSWDALMPVIDKIKQIVYAKAYRTFTLEHRMYIDICNACYDTDLQQAWSATSRWIDNIYYGNLLTMIYQFDDEKKFLHITEHAKIRFIERFFYNTDDKIELIICTDDLLNRYEKYGDGRYYVKNIPGCICYIKKYCVTTVIKSDEDIR